MGLNLRKTKIFKIISQGIIYALIFSLVCPQQALAARSSAGGGKIAKPDFGKVAQNVGITVGTAVVGSFLSNSFNSAWNTANPAANPAITQGSQVATQSTDLFTKFGNFITDIPTTIGKTINATGELIFNPTQHFGAGIGSLNSLTEVAPIIVKGYTTYTAGTQVARAVGMAGSYYGWNPKATFTLSSMAVGATSGFLNPSVALGETLLPTTSIGSAMVKGAFVGGLSGWASAATIGTIDGDKINEYKSPGTGAQVAGMAAGLYATELGKTLVNPHTYNTVVAEYTVPPSYEEYVHGNSSYTEQQIREKAGLPQFENNLQEAGLWEKNKNLSVSGGVAAMQRPENQPYLDGISREKLDFAFKVGPGLKPDSLSLPVAGQVPTQSQVLGRILLRPITETINQWPLLATRTLAMAITEKNSDKWSPLINEAVYATAAPLLDSAATMWGLKIDIDEKLGYFPEIKYQREQLFTRALVREIFAAGLAKDIKPIEENGTIIGYDVTPPAVTERLSQTEKLRIWAQYKEARDYYDKNKKPFAENEQVKVLTGVMVDIFRDRVPGGSDYEIYKKGDWSNWDAFSSTAKNAIFSELPIALISGGVQVAMNDYLDDKSPSKAMWASLGAVAATSAVRGILWHNYGLDTYGRQIRGIASHEDNPLEVFTYSPVSEADIISARIRRDLPLVDNGRFSAETEYWYKGKEEKLSDIQKKANEIGYVYGIPEEEIDLSRVNLDSVRKIVNDRVGKQGIIDGVTPETLAYLENIEQRVVRLKQDEAGSYQLGTDVDINPIADKEGFYTPVLKPYQKPALKPDTVMVFGTKDVKDGYIIKTPQEGEKYYGLEAFVINSGEILPKGEYRIPGMTTWGPYDVIKPAELMPTIVGSLGQGLFEFGWQSLAMGLAYTYQGKMGSYAWVNYQQNLYSLTRSAAMGGGIFDTMAYHTTEVGKDLVARNTLTTIADTPLGKWLGMAQFIPVSGYKGMPFSVAANIETGYRTVETRYYPYWPYQRMNVVPNDPFWRNIKVGMVHKLTGQIYIPENGEKDFKPRIEMPNLEKNIK